MHTIFLIFNFVSTSTKPTLVIEGVRLGELGWVGLRERTSYAFSLSGGAGGGGSRRGEGQITVRGEAEGVVRLRPVLLKCNDKIHELTLHEQCTVCTIKHLVIGYGLMAPFESEATS